jgi:hypothetical protein
LGGFGSGRHGLYKRTTVEECLTLDVNKLVKVDLLHRSFGEVGWFRRGVETASASYTLKERESVYVLTLHSPLNQDISLVTTELPWGGKRYWFSCPNCRRRVGTLHLPPGRNYFLCRRCYDLTYTSCRESHSFDWFFGQVGIHPSVGRRLLRRHGPIHL